MSVPIEINSPLFTTDLSRRSIVTGRVLSTLAVLFLLFDAVGKLMRPVQVVEGTTQLGWPVSVILPLGIIQAVLVVLYLVPRTAVLGAILWTGYPAAPSPRTCASATRCSATSSSRRTSPRCCGWGSGSGTAACARCCRSRSKGEHPWTA